MKPIASRLAAASVARQTLTGLFGIPVWCVLAILVIVGLLGIALGAFRERRHGGALTAAGDGEHVLETEIATMETS